MKPLAPRHSPSYRSSAPCSWVQPRSHRDASLRYMMHGPIRPMHEPGFFARCRTKLARLFRKER